MKSFSQIKGKLTPSFCGGLMVGEGKLAIKAVLDKNN